MSETFVISMPLWEIGARATVVYIVMIALVRIIPKRNAGHVSPNDMLTLIIIGTLGSDAILDDSSTIADKLLMIALVLVWGYVLDLLEDRIPALRGLFRHRQTMLVDHGRMIRKNMRREMVTEDELMAELRKEGLETLDEVRSAFMEADGEISVIAADGKRER